MSEILTKYEKWRAEVMGKNAETESSVWERLEKQERLIDNAFTHINYLSRRVDRLLYVVDKLHRGEKVEIGERE